MTDQLSAPRSREVETIEVIRCTKLQGSYQHSNQAKDRAWSEELVDDLHIGCGEPKLKFPVLVPLSIISLTHISE